MNIHRFKDQVRLITVLASIFVCVVAAPVQSAQAAINGYLGTGYFPTSNLNRCHVGGYSTEAQNASNRWSTDTDLNMYYNCSTTQITTKNASWGNTGWAGLAFICSPSYQCNNSSAFNSTYGTCEARMNQWYFSNNPGFYTSAEIQKLATHELGHCYSLDHASVTSVMNNSSVPQTHDINLINARY